MKPDLQWWDDTPDKLLADIQRMDPSAPATGKAAVTFDIKNEAKVSDPRQLDQLLDANAYEQLLAETSSH